MAKKKELTVQQQEALLATLKARFEKNMKRHKVVAWAAVEARLKASPQKLLVAAPDGGDRRASRMWWVASRRMTVTSSSIVPRKARRAAEVCATTSRR